MLFTVALAVENSTKLNNMLTNNPVTYGLALAVYCTAWTYYGSIGIVPESGILFLTIYLGSTLSIILWPILARRMIQLKEAYHITSLADFLSARYNKSIPIASLVTVIVLIGVSPYIALQLKAVISTFNLLTGSDNPNNFIGLLIVIIMTLFTIVLGVRRVDPTERHPGIMVTIAITSIIKLVAFLVAGVFITYGLFDGFGDLFTKLADNPNISIPGFGEAGGTDFTTWWSYLLLSMSAIILLPRQFHVLIIENRRKSHLKPASSIFIFYMIVINIFVIPIAIAGLLMGYPSSMADNFLLLLPLDHGSPIIALLVFLGGLSAAAMMIVVSTMTMATMISNHIILPITSRFEYLNFLKKHLLKVRWFAVVIYISIGYFVHELLADSYLLVNMGVISFAAVLQFAPALIGGLFWKRSNHYGAFLGIISGILLWFYTLMLPAFIKSGWIVTDLLEEGLFSIKLLRPEALFGFAEQHTLAHAVFWSMLFNISFFIIGSLYHKQTNEEVRTAESFVNINFTKEEKDLFIKQELIKDIPLDQKKELLLEALDKFFVRDESEDIIEKALKKSNLSSVTQLSVLDLASLTSNVEILLAGVIGTSQAHRLMNVAPIFNEQEREQLATVYGEILSELKLAPQELKERIDYYKDREELLKQNANELSNKIDELKLQVKYRKQAELELKELNEQLEGRVEERTLDLETSLNDLKETQQKLLNAEKVAALGRLVSGIAHELNTPLGVSITSVSFLKEETKHLDDLYSHKQLKRDDFTKFLNHSTESIDLVLSSLIKANELIENFKGLKSDQYSNSIVKFNIKDNIKVVIYNFQERLETMGHAIQLTCPEDIEMEALLPSFQMIFSNLIMNTMDHGFRNLENGRIDIAVSMEEDALKIVYEDNGHGLDEDSINRIGAEGFSGLGLNVVYNLVTIIFRGELECKKRAEQGLQFVIRLPLQ